MSDTGHLWDNEPVCPSLKDAQAIRRDSCRGSGRCGFPAHILEQRRAWIEHRRTPQLTLCGPGLAELGLEARGDEPEPPVPIDRVQSPARSTPRPRPSRPAASLTRASWRYGVAAQGWMSRAASASSKASPSPRARRLPGSSRSGARASSGIAWADDQDPGEREWRLRRPRTGFESRVAPRRVDRARGRRHGRRDPE